MPPKTRPNNDSGRSSLAGKTGGLKALLSSPRGQRRILLVSLVVFVAGAVAATVVFVKNTSNAFVGTNSTTTVALIKTPKTVKPSAAAFAVAREFIRTAVARKNLDVSYDIVHPDLKGRLTRKQWDTGNIPVVDYPANNINSAAFIVDFSYPTQMLLEVDLVAKEGSGVRPHLLFFIGLKRAHDSPTGRWLVNYWEPHWKPPVPSN